MDVGLKQSKGLDKVYIQKFEPKKSKTIIRKDIKFYLNNHISNDKQSIAETLILLTPELVE